MLLPYDENPNGPSGIRLGTPIITKNGMGAAEIDLIAELVDTVLSNLKPSGHDNRPVGCRPCQGPGKRPG